MHFASLLLPDFALILCGYLLCRYTALDRPVWAQVELLVYYFLFPVLLFHSITRSPLDIMAASHVVLAIVLLLGCAIGLAYAVSYIPGTDRRDHASVAQVAFRFNSFVALTLADRLGGSEGLLIMALMIGVAVPICNVGAVWPMARHGQQGFMRELVRNPLIIATVSGLIANVLGLRIPALLEPTAQRIGQAALALGLMAAGAGMQLTALRGNKLLSVNILLIKHAVLPLTAAGLAWLLQLTPLQKSLLIAFGALPSAASCYVLATRMGYNGPYAGALVTLSTALGVVSLTVWLSLFAP